ncbi:chemotaxis protein CheD [Desulfothermobacter acidiphilus]|uniref:chemotaxis protein CheD n=1 Tax=Desulfothermobacter acidiphilus TaxID=1938353 RepID=UPI003F8AC9F8
MAAQGLSANNSTTEEYVGIAELKVGRAPLVLITLGLGSCVGVALYDPIKKVGGLLHVMLPRSSEFTRNSHPAKFADTGVPLLLAELLKLGADRRLLEAKIAGGAQMFEGMVNIGERNVKAVKEALASAGIKLIAADVGGNRGRTMVLDTSTGKVIIKTLGASPKEL